MNDPPEDRVEFRFGHIQTVFRPEQQLMAVRQFDLGIEQIVAGNNADVKEALGQVPMGRALLHGLLRHIEEPRRLQDAEIGNFHLLNEVLDRYGLLHAGDIGGQTAPLIIRQDAAPGE